MRWKELTDISRALLGLTIFLFAFAFYTLGGYACGLGACGVALVLPGSAFIVGNLWPYVFLPGVFTAIGFLLSLKHRAR